MNHHGYQAEDAPKNPVPPTGAGSAVSRPDSIEGVIALAVEVPRARHQGSDIEWKNTTFTPTPEVM